MKAGDLLADLRKSPLKHGNPQGPGGRPTKLALNERQRKFAEGVAKHGNAKRAHAEAGYSVASAKGTVQRLTKNPAIQAAVNEIQSRACEKTSVTVAMIMRGLLDEAQTASHASDRIRAWSQLSKMVPGALAPAKVALDVETADGLTPELLGVLRGSLFGLGAVH
jgi:hypothetical protein